MTSKNSGSTLAAVMISVAVLSALIGVVVNVTRTQAVNTNRTLIRAQATSYGDAVLESLFDQWRNEMITATDTTDRYYGRTQEYLKSKLTPPSSAQLTPPTGISLTNWNISAVTPMLEPTTRTDGRPTPEQGSKSRLRMRLNYLVRVEVAYQGFGTDSTVILERPFIRGGRNLFDNFFFGTLPETEFHPGAPMYVDGTVYVGGNLYTAHDYLHFLKDVSYLGDHVIDYRDTDTRRTPPVTSPTTPRTQPTIDDPPSLLDNNWDPNRPPSRGSEQKLFDTRNDQLDPRFMDDQSAGDADSDGNLNNDGYHELVETPSTAGTGEDPLNLDAETSERLSQNADYRVEVDANNAVSIYKGDSTTPLNATDADATAIRNALVLNTALKDAREGQNVRLITMDISKIKAGSDSGKIQDTVGGGDGLLVYLKDKSQGVTLPNTTAFPGSAGLAIRNPSTGASQAVTNSKMRGVKLVNGGSLPKVGLTVATPHTLYIQGDYNSGKTGSTQPASNTASSYTPPNDQPSSTVSGYERVPSAVAADAVNILSNAWNDWNSKDGISSRVASNTTVNTAILAGNVPTNADSYSGGIENFVRFHENWSNRYLTVYGTLALLYNSREALGPWDLASYNPPNRRWYYDTNFQDNNPPGFRIARVYERGRWTSR